MIDPSYYLIANVEAVVHRDDGRYLLIVRGDTEEIAPGALAFPGGKVESGAPLEEAIEETARREVREETCVEVSDVRYLRSYLFFTPQQEPVLDVVVLCRYERGEARPGNPREVAAVRWMTAQELLSQPEMPPWMRRSLELAEERRASSGERVSGARTS